MTDVYHILNWNDYFETAKSRQISRCSYVCMPNKQDGLGLNRILGEPDGSSILGVWCLILQACSRQTSRDGWLTDNGDRDGRPWDVEDLAFRWRRPFQEIQRCLDFVTSPKVGWMEKIEHKCPSSSREVTTKEPSGILEQIREKERTEESASAHQPPSKIKRGKKTTTGDILAEFGIPNGPSDAKEWAGGIYKVAVCKSLDETRAFIQWASDECRRQGVIIEHWRHVRLLAVEWNNGQRDNHWSEPTPAEATS